MDIGREGRNNYTVVARLSEQRFKGLADLSLALCITGALGVGGIRHKAKYAFASYLSKSCKVYHISVYRSAVYLEVTCMDYCSLSALYCKSECIGY